VNWTLPARTRIRSARLPAPLVKARDAAALGRKGSDTRRRLLEAARALLKSHSYVELTSIAISLAAGRSAPTFYNYFADVNELILALCDEATDDFDRVMDSLRIDEGAALEVAERFIDAYNDYWEVHDAILSIRNLESDRGNVRYRAMRQRTSQRLRSDLQKVVRRLQPANTVIPQAVIDAHILVIFAAIQRFAARKTVLSEEAVENLALGQVRSAQISLLASVLRGDITRHDY